MHLAFRHLYMHKQFSYNLENIYNFHLEICTFTNILTFFLHLDICIRGIQKFDLSSLEAILTLQPSPVLSYLFPAPESAPQNFTAMGLSSTSVRLQWDPPSREVQNGKITLYEVNHHKRNSPGSAWNRNTTSNHMVVENLEAVTDYIFQVRAYTNVGAGPWTNRLPFRTFPQSWFHFHVFVVVSFFIIFSPWWWRWWGWSWW